MNIEIVKKFWEYIGKAEFDKLAEIMSADANVILANTNEIFENSLNYIMFNKDYPGRWFAEIKRIVDANDELVSAVKITNKEGVSLYVTSFFKFEKGLIVEIVEYWGENGDAPKWRQDKGYSKIYQE